MAASVPSTYDRFLDWFDRHKFGVIGTLLLHTFLMLGFAASRLDDRVPDTMAAEPELDVLPPMTDAEFSQVQQQLQEGMDAEDVKSLVSNITAERLRTTYPSRAAQERMAENIEKELLDMEKAEFHRLAQERTARGEDVVVPELDRSKWDAELYKQKAAEPARVQGNAAVWHDLKERSEHLEIPAYTCRGQGQVAIKVSVARDGRITKAELDASNTTTKDECMIERAMRSVNNGSFSASGSAPDPQRGTIYYIFIAQ